MSIPKKANTWQEKAKRKKRLNALNKQRLIGLSTERLQSRCEISQRYIDARQPLALTYQNESIYCCLTGALIGTVSADAIAAMHSLDLPHKHAVWQEQHHVHPAWFITDDDHLRELQLKMPHEYIVYAANRLEQAEANAKQRHEQLTQVYSQPLKTVVNCAELLRIVHGLFGRSPLFMRNDLPEFVPASLDFYESMLYLWVKSVVRKLQQTFHAATIDRQRIVTLADIQDISLQLGNPTFKRARIGDTQDDTLLIDLAEIFANDDDLKLATKYQKPAQKPQPFTGRTFTVQAQHETETQTEETKALPVPKPTIPKIKLFKND